jgi:phosphoribosylanthranilate isomerase
MTVVKICGISEIENAVAAAEAGADYIGMVFAASRRRVTPETASGIVKALKNISPRPLTVGVFASQSVEEVNRTAEECQLDVVQLSGGEDWDYCRRIDYPVIKVVHIRGERTAAEVFKEMRPEVPFTMRHGCTIMLDSGSGGQYGGTGQIFDWGIAREVCREARVIVAGGLNAVNVTELIETARPWGVDVSGGVETNGAKDIDKIRLFIRTVKEAGRVRKCS